MKFKIRHGSHTQSSHGPKSGCRSHIMTENSLSPTNIIQAVTFTFEQFAIIQNVKWKWASAQFKIKIMALPSICVMPVSSFVYSSTLEMECSSWTYLNFVGRHGVMSQMAELLITTAVRNSDHINNNWHFLSLQCQVAKENTALFNCNKMLQLTTALTVWIGAFHSNFLRVLSPNLMKWNPQK
jgi:hypothetical protein